MNASIAAVATHVVSRHLEWSALNRFLASITVEPSALVIEGEAGIGKTTMWLAGVERAAQIGFHVLSTRATAAESVLAYSSLADLLEGADDAVINALPAPQHRAVDQVLLRVSSDGPTTDQPAVAAAFLSVVEQLSTTSRVLIAIDDLQWLDLPSARIVSSVARRLTGPVGFLTTMRTGVGSEHHEIALELRRPDMVTRAHLNPLSIGALHKVLSERLGRSFSRPKMARIFEISGGNPFYALELARAMVDRDSDGTALPTTLAQLVRSRIETLGAHTRQLLFAASCLAEPAVELLARLDDGDSSDVAAALKEAEDRGIIEIEDGRIRFTHPLLTRGVNGEASTVRRRAMHKKLADIVDEPELKARHLAMAATTGDARTLDSLDRAAESARMRGAPAAAAELVELAIRLGGDTARRQLLAAQYHFLSGDTSHAGTVLRQLIQRLPPGRQRAEAASLLGFVHLFDDGFLEAAEVLASAAGETDGDLELKTRLLISLSYARYNAGRFGSAARSIDDAVAHAERLGQPNPLSQALSMRTTLRFLRGDGLDEASLSRALELEDPVADSPMGFRPRMQNAMLLGWTGRLQQAHDELAAIRRHCIERGEENELMFVAIHSVLVEIWRGRLTEAEAIADDTVERAQQLGGDVPTFVAMTIRAALAAYGGRADDARRDIVEALAASERCGANLLVVWTFTTLGFLEVSLGNHEAALQALAPLLFNLDVAPKATELPAASFVPDAVESMIALRRLDEAETLVGVLERNGERLDRAWMLAAAARCRAMLAAAQGDLDGAMHAAERAMKEHQRASMPFELARTQLVVGQLQRRRRHRELAGSTLRTALHTFESLGTPLWADRARAELKRASGTRTRTELTASERRVAELAATGITNKEMASALFISPKTVEANLSRIYRKLNIRSRAELGRAMSDAEE